MSLTLVPFATDHIEQALALLQANYAEERQHVPALPPVEELTLPNLAPYTHNGLGIAALLDGVLQGFIGYPDPLSDFFGLVTGTFSPLEAHAVLAPRRDVIYSRLYEASAEILVERRALSHAAVIFAHDTLGIDAFFTNGFGMRTVDAIRTTESIASRESDGIQYVEQPPAELASILPLHHGPTDHLSESPMFMAYDRFDMQMLRTIQAQRASRHFVALSGSQTIGYIEVTTEGENFATIHPQMRNICGAYLQPEFRGRGIFTAILAHTIDTLRAEGITRLGVDYEGFNPTANAFWRKHFTPYTRGLTRRIDERILSKH